MKIPISSKKEVGGRKKIPTGEEKSSRNPRGQRERKSHPRKTLAGGFKPRLRKNPPTFWGAKKEKEGVPKRSPLEN